MKIRITTIGQLKSSIQRIKGLIVQLIQAAADDISALDAAKQDKIAVVSFTIPTDGWSSDSTPDYPQYYDLAAAGVTMEDFADIAVAPSGMSAAIACGLCPVSDTLDGKIRLRAVKAPSSGISAQYRLHRGG